MTRARSMLDLSSSSSDSDGRESVDEPITTVKLGQAQSKTVSDRPTRKRASQEVIDRRMATLHANREKALQARREKAEITKKERELQKQEKALQETERVLQLKQKEKALHKKARQLKRVVSSSSDDSSSGDEEQVVVKPSRVHKTARRVVSREQDDMVQAHYRQEIERMRHDAIRKVLFGPPGHI
jgi:hypothetical protein